MRSGTTLGSIFCGEMKIFAHWVSQSISFWKMKRFWRKQQRIQNFTEHSCCRRYCHTISVAGMVWLYVWQPQKLKIVIQKGGFNQFLMFSWQMDFFDQNNIYFFRRAKCFTLANVFSSNHLICDQCFVSLSTENHLNCQLIVAFEKKAEDFKMDCGKKKSRISEDFLDFSVINRKFRRCCILSLFGQLNKWKQSLSSQKKQ